jgi:leucyl-tRNA synthetase
MHKTIKKVGEDLNNFQFNTAVATLMTWLNYLSAKEKVAKEEYAILLRLIAPFAPHITEELYQLVSKSANSIHSENWPSYQAKYLIDEMVLVVIQVNGKLRDTIQIQNTKIKQQSEVEETAKHSPKVSKYLENQSIHKVIYVEGKLINFVIG